MSYLASACSQHQCANLVTSSPPFFPSANSITHPSSPLVIDGFFGPQYPHGLFVLCVVFPTVPSFAAVLLMMFSITPPSSALPETPTRFCASRLIVPNLYGQFSRRSLPMFASPFTRFLFNLMDGFRCNFLPQTLDLHPLPPLHER